MTLLAIVLTNSTTMRLTRLLIMLRSVDIWHRRKRASRFPSDSRRRTCREWHRNRTSPCTSLLRMTIMALSIIKYLEDLCTT